jgi:ribosomal protein S21
MVHVKKSPGQSDDQVIRNFSRKVMESNIVQEAKDRRFHLSKAEKKKLEQQQLRKARFKKVA